MANPDTFPDEAGAGGLPPISRMAGWSGAILSVALVAAGVWWAVDLALRDARGVPVVRALEGPSRTAPEDPGGFEAAHQGLAVNSIASEEDVPLADRVVLAPQPTRPAPDDIAPPEAAPAARETALRSAVGAAVLQAIGIAPEEGDGGSSAEDDLPVALPDAPGVASPRPLARPEVNLATRAIPAALPLPVAGASVIAPDAIPPGTRLVQLGAFDSAEAARASWERLSESFGGYLDGKAQVIERTVLSGQEFYRLRLAGFDDLPDARSFCAVLLAEQADCIPVLTR